MAERHRGHVLLVEDDPDLAALAREMLTSLAFSVTHVLNAAAALNALDHSQPIHAVVSDIVMPGGVTGVQLAREIRRWQPKLPVVLTTGYAEAAAGLKDGEFPLLLKPFTLEALASALGVDVSRDG